MVREMAARLPVPRKCRDLGALVAELHTHCHRAFELRADTVVKVLEKADAFRRPERFQGFLAACEADARGRTGFEQRDYPQAGRFRDALSAAGSVDAAAVAAAVAQPEVAAALRRARVDAVRHALRGQIAAKTMMPASSNR
jgi:tRNA nucleotidyltransferase (CCA-adding enzyme)